MTTFAQDGFTDTAGVALTAHTPVIGGPWSVKSGVDGVISNANRLRTPNASGAGTSEYKFGSSPGDADYTVRGTFRFLSSFANAEYGLLARIADGATTFYSANYEIPAAAWKLYRTVAGSWTPLGSAYSMAFPTGQDVVVELRCNNGLKEVWIDGVQRITSTDNTITNAGFAGCRIHNGNANFASDTTGVHLDSFEAEDVTAPPTTTYAHDTFTDTTDTLLSAHTADVGGAWTRGTGDTAGAAPVIRSDGRLRKGGTADQSDVWKTSGQPTTANYRMSMDIFNPLAGATADEDWPELRARESGTNRIKWGYDGLTRDVYLYIAGAQIFRTNTVLSIPQNTSKGIALEVEGDVARCYWDGALRHTQTGLTLLAQGTAELGWWRGGVAPDDTNSLRIDNYRIEALAGGQIVVPNSTIAAGGWLDHTGSATDLHSPLADESASTWVQSAPGSGILKLGLTDVGPFGAGDIIFEVDAEQAP